MGIFAPDAIPEWLRISLFWLGAILALIGVFAAIWHYRPKGWLSRHVLWRFKRLQPAVEMNHVKRLGPPNQGPNDEVGIAIADSRCPDGSYDYSKLRSEIDRITDPDRKFREAFAERSGSNTVEQVAAAPRPKFASATESDDLGYPYAKAVLKPEISIPVGTQSANAGEKAHSMSVVMEVKADHGSMLANCYIELSSLIVNGVTIAENEILKAGAKEGKFTVGPSRSHRFTFLNRDMQDPITPAPFMLHFIGKQQPLKENADYVANLRLRSPEYKWPIMATVEIATGEGLIASATVTHIGLPEEAYDE